MGIAIPCSPFQCLLSVRYKGASWLAAACHNTTYGDTHKKNESDGATHRFKPWNEREGGGGGGWQRSCRPTTTITSIWRGLNANTEIVNGFT